MNKSYQKLAKRAMTPGSGVAPVGLKHWPGKKAEQYTLARLSATGHAIDYHCRYGMAVPYYPKCDSQADGVPFTVHDAVIRYKGLSILQIEPCDVARAPADPGDGNVPEFVGCFNDRLYIPGEGSYVVRTDSDRMRELFVVAKRLADELGMVMELLPPATLERVAEAMPTTTDFIAECVSLAVCAYRSGASATDTAVRSMTIGEVNGVSHELACVVGLFTNLCVVSEENPLGVDVVLGVTRLVHVDTGETLELFTRSPKW